LGDISLSGNTVYASIGYFATIDFRPDLRSVWFLVRSMRRIGLAATAASFGVFVEVALEPTWTWGLR
jgi:hypothetical protein